jgi:hypothetical protein
MLARSVNLVESQDGHPEGRCGRLGQAESRGDHRFRTAGPSPSGCATAWTAAQCPAQTCSFAGVFAAASMVSPSSPRQAVSHNRILLGGCCGVLWLGVPVHAQQQIVDPLTKGRHTAYRHDVFGRPIAQRGIEAAAMNQDTFWLVLSIAVLLTFGARWLLRRRKLALARSWPTVTGRVESTATRLEQRGGGQSVHVGEVTYSYSLEGREYSGSWRRQFMLHSSLERWTGGYQAGQPLMVRYNPDKPHDSVLDDATGSQQGRM